MQPKSKPFTFFELLFHLPWILREPANPKAVQILPREIGLGDTVHNRLERLWQIGPKVRAYTAKRQRNCGCEARRQQLNRLWPYPPKRGQVFLTIGMAHFQDWEGAWATIQSVLWEAQSAGISDKVEILVVDQSADSEAGKKVKGYLAGWVPRSKYIAQPNIGTAGGKSAVFQHASGEWVVLLDCHAALKPGSLKKMFDFMVSHRSDGNLYSGVMDLGAGYHWHRHSLVKLAETMVNNRTLLVAGAKIPNEFWHLSEAAIGYVAARVLKWLSVAPNPDPLASTILGTDHGYHTHVDRVWRGDSLGRWATDPRAATDDSPIFEIDNMAGWFLFCRRDAWLMAQPYHPLMRGFGGEEGVMTLAFARRGRKTYLAPFARGAHRFGRADGIKFPLLLVDRLRNYALAFHSLGRRDELDRMRHYFTTERGKKEIEGTAKDHERFSPMPEAEFDAIVAGAIAEHEAFIANMKDKRNPPPKPLLQLYEEAANTPSDFNEHVPILRDLAAQCEHVTEFGTRHGVSTVALVAAQPRVVVTVDKACAGCHIGFLMAVAGETDLRLVQADSLEIDIEPTDLLFVDTFHSADQLFAELSKHAKQARRFIALHDTEAPWGYADEGGTPGGGIRAGLARWQATEEGQRWQMIEDRKNNHGFAVLKRMEA